MSTVPLVVDVGAAEAARDRSFLSVDGLRRRFKDRVALDGVSFAVRPGEIFGLLGPNGAGKSTAFKILASLLRPDAGRVWLEGRERAFADRELRARMGVIFQRGSLDDQLTARENLLLGARLYAVEGERARRRAEEMLELIGLKDRGDERVAGWSGGMRRRLELARALIHEPALLLMDEPTQGLDEASFRSFWSHLHGLRKSRGLTVLLTTHRPEEAEQCDRLAVLDAGKVVACDTPAAFVAQVRGDVLTLETDEPARVVSALVSRLGLDAHVLDGAVHLERDEGHALVPRIVEALPPGTLKSVSLRRASLADVFLQITGHALGVDGPAEAAAPRRRR